MNPPETQATRESGIDWLRDASPEELRRTIDALYRARDLFSHLTDLDSLLEKTLEQGQRAAHAEACSLLLYDEPSEELFFHVALSERGNPGALRDIRLKRGQGIAGAAAAARRSVRVDDAATDERFFGEADTQTDFETRSLLAVPLIHHDELVGVIEVLNKRGGGGFSDRDQRVLEIFASWVAAAIANARLIEENLKQERLAALGQAVAGVSHFTKNILLGLGTGIEMVDEGLADKDTATVESAWPVVKRSASRISMLVEDMLAFSKPRKPLREPTSVQAIVDEAVDQFRGLMTKQNIELVVKTEAGGECVVDIDARGIFRCLLNLLTNAADAAPAGNGKVLISATGTDDEVIICVEDNGSGIPPDMGTAIFEPFFSTKGSRGTGLGLPVTKKIIEEHGGTLDVDTGELGGAQFRISLPRTEAHGGDE